MSLDEDLLALQEVRDLLKQADNARRTFATFTQEQIDKVVAALSEASLSHAEDLARMAMEETGYGNVEDKKLKNTFAAKDVYFDIKDMKTVGIVNFDEVKKVYEIAVPMGIVAGIIPSTNPTSTTIYKALIAVKAGNAIVFSPHPKAKECILKTVAILREAALTVGAPDGLISCLSRPTMAATNELIRHKLTSVILATGGHGLVKAAYSSGKPAFGVGPGNVPAFIERSADVEAAVNRILAGKCFDNGTICASEQSVIVDSPVDEKVRDAFLSKGAYFCTTSEKKLLEKLMVVNNQINPSIVGKPAPYIAKEAGFSVPDEICALIVECSVVGNEEPLSREKLSPVLAYYKIDGWQEGCEKCIEILNFGGLGHTMVIHSTNQEVIMKFALEKPAFRILVNTSGSHGAIGYSTGLTPSLTLGCGTWGNNITTDNITAKHLVNIKRLAYETKQVGFVRSTERIVKTTEKVSNSLDLEREKIKTMVRDILKGILSKNSDSHDQTKQSIIEEESCDVRAFVSESDVVEALAAGQKIYVDNKTIMTPSAREVGKTNNIFVWVGELDEP